MGRASGRSAFEGFADHGGEVGDDLGEFAASGGVFAQDVEGFIEGGKAGGSGLAGLRCGFTEMNSDGFAERVRDGVPQPLFQKELPVVFLEYGEESGQCLMGHAPEAIPQQAELGESCLLRESALPIATR